MTDSIDLDDVETDDESEAERPNRGDWFWRGEGDPADERPGDDSTADESPADDPVDGESSAGEPSAGEPPGEQSAATTTGGHPADTGTSATPAVDGPAEGDGPGAPSPSPQETAEAEQGTGGPMPRVPRDTEGKPTGIPVESGGAGAGPEHSEEAPPREASGPHGGGADDMTMALTYGAARRLSDPSRVVADASRWADWFGIVGDVAAHVINKFQRDHAVDVDFFNGSGTGPAERLAEIDEHSMFFAERMVVVGVAGEDEGVAEAAGWEFVPLETAAEKAGWALSDEE